MSRSSTVRTGHRPPCTGPAARQRLNWSSERPADEVEADAPTGARASDARSAAKQSGPPSPVAGDPEPPARGSWRRTDPSAVVALNALMARLRAVIGVLRAPSWWREYDPLTVQRILVVILVALALLLVLALR